MIVMTRKIGTMMITVGTLIKDFIDGRKRFPKIFDCPSCGRQWDSNKHNACQCGAVIYKSADKEKRST